MLQIFAPVEFIGFVVILRIVRLFFRIFLLHNGGTSRTATVIFRFPKLIAKSSASPISSRLYRTSLSSNPKISDIHAPLFLQSLIFQIRPETFPANRPSSIPSFQSDSPFSFIHWRLFAHQTKNTLLFYKVVIFGVFLSCFRRCLFGCFCFFRCVFILDRGTAFVKKE